MKLRHLLSYLVILSSYFGFGQLIISEYLEGASNDKCIEIYNTSPTSVDMTGWSLQLFSNGSSTASSTYNLTGTINGCDTYVICHTSSNASLQGIADALSGSIVNFNGDDAIALHDGTSIVDVFGDIGTDPGSEWGSSPGTSDGHYIRNAGACTAVGDESGFPSLGTNWTGSSLGTSTDTYDFGAHTSTCCSSVTISIDNLNGAPFSVGCTSNDVGTVDFSTTGTFNAGNNFIIEMSDASGSFASATTISDAPFSASGVDPSGSIDITIPSGTVSGSGYLIRIVSSDPTSTTVIGSPFTITLNCITTISSVSGGPFSVDCTGSDDSGSVTYTTSDDYGSGNTFTVLLSDASGDFSSPITIGSTSDINDGSISITIPENMASGSGYQVQIVSSNPVTTSSPSSSFTITQTGSCIVPHLTSVIINSCNDICGEGVNEIVFGNTGDYEIEVTEANFNFSYTNTGALNNYTDNLTNNATTTTELNDMCASTDPFIDAYGTTIPANSSWILVNDAICPSDALDWTGLCNSGPIYIVYSTDSNWSPTGNFSNTTSGIRPYQTSMTTTSGDTFTLDYETDGSQYADSDGVFANFSSDGGPATAYGDNDCLLEPELLSSNLISFTAKKENSTGIIQWKVKEEVNVSHYYIYHSTNGVDWTELTRVSAENAANGLANYSFVHFNLEGGYNYYKLTSVDFDGSEKKYGIRAIHKEMNFAYFDAHTHTIELQEKSNYLFYTVDGKLLGELIDGDSFELNNFQGMLIIKDALNQMIQRVLVK